MPDIRRLINERYIFPGSSCRRGTCGTKKRKSIGDLQQRVFGLDEPVLCQYFKGAFFQYFLVYFHQKVGKCFSLRSDPSTIKVKIVRVDFKLSKKFRRHLTLCCIAHLYSLCTPIRYSIHTDVLVLEFFSHSFGKRGSGVRREGKERDVTDNKRKRRGRRVRGGKETKKKREERRERVGLEGKRQVTGVKNEAVLCRSFCGWVGGGGKSTW